MGLNQILIYAESSLIVDFGFSSVKLSVSKVRLRVRL